METKQDILKSSLEAREQEIILYQINIDNYTMALDDISKMEAADRAELSGFAEDLRNRLASEKTEQKKAMVMYRVVKAQVE